MALSRPSQGIALVVVLWVITLLSVIATSFATSMRTEVELARELMLSAQARALAEAGIYRSVLELFNRDSLQAWQPNGTVYQWRFGSGEIRIMIQDEGGKIDLNSGQEHLIEGALRAAGVSDLERIALLDAIVDWRDPDNLRRLHGAEDEEYAAAGLSYGAKDGPFNCVEELQQVLGMTPALYQRLEPALTVHSHRAGVDPQVAPVEVLQAIEALEAARAGIESSPSTAGLQISIPEPSPNKRYRTSSAVQTFTLQAAAKVFDTIAQITAIIKLGSSPNQPFSVIAWKEGGRSLFHEAYTRANKRH